MHSPEDCNTDVLDACRFGAFVGALAGSLFGSFVVGMIVWVWS